MLICFNVFGQSTSNFQNFKKNNDTLIIGINGHGKFKSPNDTFFLNKIDSKSLVFNNKDKISSIDNMVIATPNKNYDYKLNIYTPNILVDSLMVKKIPK